MRVGEGRFSIGPERRPVPFALAFFVEKKTARVWEEGERAGFVGLELWRGRRTSAAEVATPAAVLSGQ